MSKYDLDIVMDNFVIGFSKDSSKNIVESYASIQFFKTDENDDDVYLDLQSWVHITSSLIGGSLENVFKHISIIAAMEYDKNFCRNNTFSMEETWKKDIQRVRLNYSSSWCNQDVDLDKNNFKRLKSLYRGKGQAPVVANDIKLHLDDLNKIKYYENKYTVMKENPLEFYRKTV